MYIYIEIIIILIFYELTAQWHRQYVSPSQASLPVKALLVPPALVSLLAAAGFARQEEGGGKHKKTGG